MVSKGPIWNFNFFRVLLAFNIMLLLFEVKCKRKRGRPRKTLKTQVEKESKNVGLEKEDALNRAR